MAAKSHERKCGPCYLCKKESYKYIHSEKMDSNVSKLISDIEGLDLGSETYICHACYKQASRNIANPKYHPRWRQKKTLQKEICGLLNCNEVAYRHTKIASRESIESLVGEKLAPLSITHIGTPLCQDHYTYVNSSLHARQPCESCGSKPKRGERDYFRHCSSPEVVNSYLNVISGEISTLTASSNICMSCYRLSNGISTQLAQAKSGGENSSETLKQTCAIIASQINSIKSEHSEISKSDYIELSLCYTAQKLAQVMAKNEVMLLPVLHGLFQDYVINGMADFAHLTITTDEIPSTRWLISRLHSYYGDSIVFECKHRYVGTMVFHKSCDLLKALSAVLGQQKQVYERQSEESPDSSDNLPSSLDESIKKVAHHLNSKLHEQAKKFISEFKNADKYTSFNISSLLKDTDPVLLQFIEQLTCTVHETRRRLFNTEDMDVTTIRHFYILCILLFNTNNVEGPIYLFCSALRPFIVISCLYILTVSKFIQIFPPQSMASYRSFKL